MRAVVLVAGLYCALGTALAPEHSQAQTPNSQGGSSSSEPAIRDLEQKPKPRASESEEEPRKKPVEDLIGELLTAEESEDDLAWLYSDEDYEATDLAGRTIPAPALPERGEGTPRFWDPRWRKFDTTDTIITSTAWGVALTGAFVPTAPGRWQTRNEFDESVRGSLSIEDYDRGQWARDVSDLLLSVNVAFPLLIDSLIVTYWYRASPEVAAQMALITTEALGIASAIHSLTAGLASRQRPYVRNCGGLINPQLDDCDGKKPYRSFFSGHTVMAFAGAGATCTLHAQHEVFGSDAADAITCSAALASAATVGMMRVVGDQHFATDVFVGATIGLMSGTFVPWLLHYRLGSNPQQGSEDGGLNFTLVPASNGLGLRGDF